MHISVKRGTHRDHARYGTAHRDMVDELDDVDFLSDIHINPHLSETFLFWNPEKEEV